MTEGYVPKTATYPAWFIKQLAKAIDALEAFDKALGESMGEKDYTPTMYVETVPLKHEDLTIGTLHWLDDQWQFEPDVTYWGLGT